jgi:hypothetical protein
MRGITRLHDVGVLVSPLSTPGGASYIVITHCICKFLTISLAIVATSTTSNDAYPTARNAIQVPRIKEPFTVDDVKKYYLESRPVILEFVARFPFFCFFPLLFVATCKIIIWAIKRLKHHFRSLEKYLNSNISVSRTSVDSVTFLTSVVFLKR